MIEDVEMGGELLEKHGAQAKKSERLHNEEGVETHESHRDNGEVPKNCERGASNGVQKATKDVGCLCVTGAGGFIASWLVKHLLAEGYFVKGTVRNPDDPKNAHLKQLEGASERLVLAKADLMDFDSMLSIINGCDGIFHLASPVTDDPVQMVEPAIKGTLNVLEVAKQCGVKRVVMTSSIGAVYMDPNRDPKIIVDESCWSDLDYCKDTKNWYCYGKTVAEKAAWDYAKEKGIDLVVLNPSLVLGPLLQPTMNASTGHLLKYLTDAQMRRNLEFNLMNLQARNYAT